MQRMPELRHDLAELCIQVPPDAPAPQRDPCPNRLDQSERPGALQETVNRTQRAGDGKSEDEPAAAILQRIGDQHGGDGEQAEQTKDIHRSVASSFVTSASSHRREEWYSVSDRR